MKNKNKNTRLFWFGWLGHGQGTLRDCFSRPARYWTQVHCGDGIPEDGSLWGNKELRNPKPCQTHHAVVSGEGRWKKRGPHMGEVSLSMKLDLRGSLTKSHWHPGLKTAVWPPLGCMSRTESAVQSAWLKTCDLRRRSACQIPTKKLLIHMNRWTVRRRAVGHTRGLTVGTGAVRSHVVPDIPGRTGSGGGVLVHPTAHTPILEPADALLFNVGLPRLPAAPWASGARAPQERSECPCPLVLATKGRSRQGRFRTHTSSVGRPLHCLCPLCGPHHPYHWDYLKRVTQHPNWHQTAFSNLFPLTDKDGARGTGCFSQPFSSSGCHVGCFVISISRDITVPWMVSGIILASLRSRHFLIKRHPVAGLEC